MNTTHVRNTKSLAVAILATMQGVALAQQPLDPGKPVQVITNKLTGTGTKEGKIDSPLYTVFGKTTIPGGASAGVPAAGINVRSYTLPDGQHDSNPALTPPHLPGPTFVFQPGDLLRLRFHNFLNRSTNPALNSFANDPQGGFPNQGNPGASDDTAGHVSHEISIPNDSDITNLHVHGLHVDPKQDNVTLLILPEDTDPSGLVPELQRFVPTINRWWTRTYRYKLPADHLPGTFWYHAHKHGSTSTQVENGMAGSLLILPPDIQLPPAQQTRTIVPGLWNADPAKSHDRILMIQQIANFGIGQDFGLKQGKGLLQGKSPGQGKSAAKAVGGTQPPVNNINAPVTTINGQYQPTMELPATQIERWRFVVAGANHTTSSYLWVGSMTPVIPAETQTALKAITKQTPKPTSPTDPSDATNYINGTVQFPKVTKITCSALPGTVKIVAADGIDIWQPRDITPSSPGLGSAGNRLDFLVQASDGAAVGGPYAIYMNYPSNQVLTATFPDIFGPNAPAGAACLSALTRGQVTGGSPAMTLVDGANKTAPVPPNSLPTDPYALGILNQGPNAFSVWWATVDAEGKPLPVAQQPTRNGKLIQQQVVPLLTATFDGKGIKIDSTVADGPGVKIDQIWANQKTWPDGRWQPANAGSGLPVTNAILAKLNITDKSKASGPTTLPPKLNDIASALSPAGTGSRLTRVDPGTRQLVPGIPSYVAPIKDSDIAGYQVAVFDRGQFSFDYINKATQLTQPFRQFWITGRQFSIDDWVGNPATQRLMRTPLINLEPSLGSYNPASTETLWTHQKTLGDTAAGPIFITNPGYTAKVTAMPGTIGGNTYYNYDHPNAKPLTYQSVTGLAEKPHTPVSTTAEEWLLVNNSDMFHPFHIHINPFFVTEIGQLNYAPGASSPPWSLKKVTLADKGNSAVPFSWVVGNWWDVITLPPHGYVRMRMWINVPSQLPANVDDRVPDNDLTVYDNANVYGSWVMHCHILRHEDRGMMSMVNTEPKSTSLAGEWTQDGGGTSTIADNHGGLRITPPPPATPPNAISPSYPGTFSRGIGNPLFSQPWLGSMSPAVPAVITFCATANAQEMVRSDGHLWARGTTAPKAITFVTTNLDLSGNWIDDGGNVATIKQSPPNAGVAGLNFTPVSPVWWSSGTGSWAPPTAAPAGVYAGTQTVVNNAKQNQQLTFCVSGDLKTIVFGNGVKWKKQ